jgi:hypothetical protein
MHDQANQSLCRIAHLIDRLQEFQAQSRKCDDHTGREGSRSRKVRNPAKASGAFACFAGSPPHFHHCERECRPEKRRHARPGLCNRNRHYRNLIGYLAFREVALLAVRLRFHRRTPSGCRRSRCGLLRPGALRLHFPSVFHPWPTECDAVSSAAVHARWIIVSAARRAEPPLAICLETNLQSKRRLSQGIAR